MDKIISLQSSSMIGQNFHQKYDPLYNSFFFNPINELVTQKYVKASTIEYKDTILFSNSKECLRREYSFKNSWGKDQISDRIEMFGELYDEPMKIHYDYPTAILTNTNKIFLKRIKRMTKIIQVQSGTHPSSQSSPAEIDSSPFLRTLNSEEPSQSSNSMNRSSLPIDNQYDSSIMNIYDQNHLQISFTPQTILNASELKEHREEEKVSHLICDLDEVDEDRAISNFKKVKNYSAYLEPKKEEKKSKIIITPIDYIPSSVQFNTPIKKQQKQQQTKNSFKNQHEETLRLTSYSNESAKSGLLQSSLFSAKLNEQKTQRLHCSSKLTDLARTGFSRKSERSKHGNLNEKKNYIKQRATALLAKVRSCQQIGYTWYNNCQY